MNRTALLSFVLFCSLGFGALAQGQRTHVLNPWDNSGSATTGNTTPRVAALLPLRSQLPEWVFHEVLNPWGQPPTTPDRRVRPDERALSMQARARADELVQCFPRTGNDVRHFSHLQVGAAETTLERITSPIHRCLGPLVKDLGQNLQLPTSHYTLVLFLDDDGLRHVYLVSTDRLPS